MNETPETLEQAFVRLRERLRTYLRRRLPDATQVDDVLQDVFLKTLASQQAGREIGNLAGWLHAAVRTAIVDAYRRRGVATVALDIDAILPEETRNPLESHSELAACLQPLVERLPEAYRSTLRATDLHGSTMRAVAEAEGVSVSAIKSRAVRGRRMLKDMLETCCHVEVEDGLVSDFQRRPSGGCSGGCG